jgi:hypothetical protein
MQFIKFFCTAIFLSMGIVLFAQNEVSPDSRLLAKYQEQDLQNMLANSPEKIDFLNFTLDNSYVVIDVESEKAQSLPVLHYFNKMDKAIGAAVVSINEGSLNIYDYYFDRKLDKAVTYRIGDTGKAIVFYSNKELTHAYNQYRNEE